MVSGTGCSPLDAGGSVCDLMAALWNPSIQLAACPLLSVSCESVFKLVARVACVEWSQSLHSVVSAVCVHNSIQLQSHPWEHVCPSAALASVLGCFTHVWLTPAVSVCSSCVGDSKGIPLSWKWRWKGGSVLCLNALVFFTAACLAGTALCWFLPKNTLMGLYLHVNYWCNISTH